jgi:chromate transporter
VTFVPCFIWIFAGAPLIDWLDGQPRLQGALSGITAAVVGVIANLSLWFAAHVFFARVVTVDDGVFNMILPRPETLNGPALILACVAAALLLWRGWGLLSVLGVTAAGYLLDAPNSWALALFYPAAACQLFGAIMYTIFASSERQPWS